MQHIKQVTAHWFILALSTSAATTLADEVVTTTISPGRVSILAVEALEMRQSDFNPNNLLESFLDLELRLQVEGNLCGDDTLAFELELGDTETNLDTQEYNLFLRSMRQEADRIHLTQGPCPLISMPLEITAPLHIAPQILGADTTFLRWDYHLQDTFFHHGTLSIQLDAENGWDAELLPPEEANPDEDTPSQGDKVFLRGTLTDEGVECPAMRATDGTLYTLIGELNSQGVKVGGTVYVVGRVVPFSFCMQGTTLEVDWISQEK